MTLLRLIVIQLLLPLPSLSANGQSDRTNSFFALRQTADGITSLKRAGDESGLDFIRDGSVLGPIKLRVRHAAEDWQDNAKDHFVDATSTFVNCKDELKWKITVRNHGQSSVEMGDLQIPLPMSTDYSWNREETFTKRVFKHAFIAGSGSFLYWLPVNGTGPILVMQPQAGTRLEFFTSEKSSYASGGEDYSVFVHSKATEELNGIHNWRQPRTSRKLASGEQVTYSFVFHWAKDYAGVRRTLFRNNGVDIYVAPGMVIPQDLTAWIGIRTKRGIRAIEPEFAGSTVVQAEQSTDPKTHILRVKFSRLGENRLSVKFDDGGSMPLEYFVTLPLESLIKKRASFVVNKQQHRVPDKWYDGLFSLWDQRLSAGKCLLGPDNLGGQEVYAVSGSDDPCNGKALLVAEKNVAYPDFKEINALEYYLQHFVWGKLQRTDQETPFPFGIYGSNSWKENRCSERDPLADAISRPGGPSACHMWRSYDYTTFFALYFDMYRIAKQRPESTRYLDATGYLDRAFGTARAYFSVPAGIYMDGGWTHKGWVYWQYTTGNFHEKYLLPLIAALAGEDRTAQAQYLTNEWEKKVKYMIYDDSIPFVSEMPIDSTAYESTYAVADYALTHTLEPDSDLWQDRNEHRSFSHPDIDPKRHADFMKRQLAANLACRGVLEANYWSLGSDFRGSGSANYTLSYMSQMGGWPVLDYALRFDPQPAANLRLGYASILSSWALMNAGDQESNYGYWKPGKLNDGAVGWGFQPQEIADGWNPATKKLVRGAWPVCGEIDHGLAAAVAAARTVVYDDPLFGVIALGGELHQSVDLISVVPRDGVRQRFSLLLNGRRIHIELDRDGFAADRAVSFSPDTKSIEFVVEDRGVVPHDTTVHFEGLRPGRYAMQMLGETSEVAVAKDGRLEASIHILPSSENVLQLVQK